MEGELAQILIVIGAAIFGLLGVVHLALTFLSNKFDPYDASVTEAMKQTSPRLTKRTTMWKAWIGFNASHSYGAILIAAFYIPLAVYHFEIIEQSLWFLLLPIVVALSYLVLAKLYWFRTPLVGIAISTLCFIGAAIDILV